VRTANALDAHPEGAFALTEQRTRLAHYRRNLFTLIALEMPGAPTQGR